MSGLPIGPGALVINRPCRPLAEEPGMAPRRHGPAGVLFRLGWEGRERPTGSRQRLRFCLPVEGEGGLGERAASDNAALSEAARFP